MSPLQQPSPVLVDAHLEQVLRLIRRQGATTRPALGEVTGLSRKVVTQRIDQLVSMGLVREVEEHASTGGRPAALLGFAAGSGSVLAVVLGATGLTAGLTDLSGRVLVTRSRRLPFGAPPRVALPRVQALFDRLLEEAAPRGPLRGIGVGVLGPVSPQGLTMDTLPNGGWEGFSVSDWFTTRYGVPVWVDNEVNLMAVGEAGTRTMPGAKDLLYIKVSTGIGAGLIADGRLYRGGSGVAGELGHTTISADRSLVCWCGKSGCLVSLASGRAIAKFGATAMRKGHSPYLADIPARQIRDSHVVAGAHVGDKACTAIMQRAGEALGLSVAAATNLFNPAMIVLGGRVAGSAGDLFTGPVRQAVAEHAFPLAAEAMDIQTSQNGHAAGVSGAATVVLEGLLTGEHLAGWQPSSGDESRTVAV